MVGIYKFVSPSGKVYIGQSWDIEKRFKDHGRHYKQARHTMKFYNSIRKYGFESHKFEIIHELPADVDQCVLDSYEQLYMDFYRDGGFELLNLKEGGSNGKLSEELKQKMRGRTVSNETRSRLSESRKGLKLSDEVKKKLRERRRLNPHTRKETQDEALAKIHQSNIGKKTPQEKKEKIRHSLKEFYKNNPDVLRTMSRTRIESACAIGSNNANSKLTEEDVREIRRKFIPRVYSRPMLAKEYGISIHSIAKILNRETWSHVA